jgi:hypothetical protein
MAVIKGAIEEIFKGSVERSLPGFNDYFVSNYW